MSERRAFQAAAVSWAIYAFVTTLPALSYPELVASAVIRAGLGLLIAWFFWSRPGSGIASVGALLGLFLLVLAFVALRNPSALGYLNLVIAAVGVLVFVTSAYCWWLTMSRDDRES